MNPPWLSSISRSLCGWLCDDASKKRVRAGHIAPTVRDRSKRAPTVHETLTKLCERSLCAHMEGLMILAKPRNDPTIIRRLSTDGRRLAGALVNGPTRTERC